MNEEYTIEAEKTFIVMFITNDEFCHQMLPVFRPEYFDVSFVRTIYGWVKEHYAIYKQAPRKAMRQIFGAKYSQLPPEDAEYIEIILAHLDSLEVEETSIDFHISRAREYARKQSLSILSQGLQTALEQGKTDIAETLIRDHKKVAEKTKQWLTPSEFTDVWLADRERKAHPLFTYEGDLGKFIGPLQRGWLVYFMGPPKRGKSNYILETAVRGLSLGLRTVVFSHEMGEADWLGRFIKMLAPGIEEGSSGTSGTSIFDCLGNVLGTCQRRERTGCGPRLLDNKYNARYAPCNAGRELSCYDPVITSMFREPVYTSEKKQLEKIKGLRTFFQNKLRVMCYSPYSSSVLDMEQTLHMMNYADGFKPDLILDDYLGAHACGDKRLIGRDIYDFEAKHSKRLAKDFDALYISAFQGTRGSIDKRVLKQQDTAEDIRIVNHCDKIITINQTSIEKKYNTLRIGKSADRHMDSIEGQGCTITNNISAGRVVIDSVMGNVKTLQERLAEE